MTPDAARTVADDLRAEHDALTREPVPEHACPTAQPCRQCIADLTKDEL